MITTGAKLVVGAAVVATAAAVVYGLFAGGALGVLGLSFAAVALFFLGGVVLATRDADVSALDTAAVVEAPAAAPVPTASMWPAVMGLGAGLVAVGLVTYQVVLIFGFIALLAAGVEWMIQAWSERASAEAGYNAELRGRLAHPLEFPILAAVGAGILVYSFSRVMLFLSKTGGPVVFATIALLVLVGAFIVAFNPSLRSSALAIVAAIAALGLIAGGAAAALGGEREIEAHGTTGDLAAAGSCADDAETEADENASQTVAAKAGVTAELVLDADGRLVAHVDGVPGEQSTVYVNRSATTNVLFRNHSDEPRRLLLDAGTRLEDPTDAQSAEVPYQWCTAIVEEDGTQLLTFRIDRTTASQEAPIRFVVPGVDGAEVEVVVP